MLMSGEGMPISGNLVQGGGMMGLGRVNKREQGEMEYVFDSWRKKMNFVPLFFVKHLALTLLLCSLPPYPPSLSSWTQTERQGPENLWDTTPASLMVFSPLRYKHLDISSQYGVCMCPLLQQADTKGGEREIQKEREWQKGSEGGRGRGRIRLKKEKGGGELYMLVSCLWYRKKI